MSFKHWLIVIVIGSILVAFGFLVGSFISNSTNNHLPSTNNFSPSPTPLPLLKYSIPELSKQQFENKQIFIEKELTKEKNFTSYLFSYLATGGKITGQVNIPNEVKNQILKPSTTGGQIRDNTIEANSLQPAISAFAETSSLAAEMRPIIILIRGYIPPETCSTGDGTRNAAKYFADQGFITFAPDFLDCGESDPSPEDPWEARLIKPIQVAELIENINDQMPKPSMASEQIIDSQQSIYIWAHSNGGQIALTMLEITGWKIPTTLWAPVTAPFPYSVLFYSDESDDEGKQARKWVSLFEKKYNAFDFSLTQHLDKINAPLQIHQGNLDDAVPLSWSKEFAKKLDIENEKRKKILNGNNLQPTTDALQPITYELFIYPNADHNLQPGHNWQQAIERDVKFFKNY